MVVFPAGAVSTAPDKLGLQPAVDARWQPFVCQLIQRSKATVVPIWFGGQNSRLFQIASHLSQTLRISLIFHEVKSRIGATLPGRDRRADPVRRLMPHQGPSGARRSAARPGLWAGEARSHDRKAARPGRQASSPGAGGAQAAAGGVSRSRPCVSDGERQGSAATPPGDGLRRDRTGAASPRKMIAARLKRTRSSSPSRPIRAPNFDFGTVVILSTIRRQAELRPLRALGATGKRNNGASVSSVVKAQIVIDFVEFKAVVLHDQRRPGLSRVILSAGDRPDLAALHASVSSETASINA